MAKTWDQFYHHVQPSVPGCPEITMDIHLQSAAADFCERSEVWHYDIETDSTFANVNEYPLDKPAGAVVENLISLYLDGELLKRVTPMDFKSYPTIANSRPTAFTIFEDEQIKFYPTPDASYEFSGFCVLKPSTSATGVEDFIYETHARTIACGALASLLIIPGKEWTNMELATYYKMKFDKATDDAKGRDTRRANRRVKSVNFA